MQSQATAFIFYTNLVGIAQAICECKEELASSKSLHFDFSPMPEVPVIISSHQLKSAESS